MKHLIKANADTVKLIGNEIVELTMWLGEREDLSEAGKPYTINRGELKLVTTREQLVSIDPLKPFMVTITQ